MDKKLASLLTFSIIVSCAQSQCNTSEPYLQDCAALFKIFRGALFNTNETDNIFLLQSVFYPSTQVSPVLVKVTYKLNITKASHQLKSCPGPKSTFCLSDGIYTFGWTSQEIYRIFHPVIINHLRFQLPFLLLQLSENIHSLTEYYDLEVLLWDGTQSLSSLDLVLNVDFTAHNFGCYPKAQLIQEALGELTQWLRAYAKVSQRESYKFATAEDKGVALDCTSVSNYTSSKNYFTNGGRYGNGILVFTYTIGFILVIGLTPILLPLLFKIIRDLLQRSDKNYDKMFLAGACTISTGYTIMSVSIAFYQVTRYINEFDHMKAAFLLVILFWMLVVTIFSALYFRFDEKNFSNSHRKRILHFAMCFAAFSLSSFTGIVMLSFAPTILLLFAYPVDTSSLLILHIASFYSTTIVLAVFFRGVKEWIINHDSIFGTTFFSRCCDGNDSLKRFFKWLIFGGLLLLGMVLFAMLPLTYVCIILLYQFVVARSEVNQLLAYSNFATYIPSIVIAVFGYIIKKGAFDLPYEETAKEKNEAETAPVEA